MLSASACAASFMPVFACSDRGEALPPWGPQVVPSSPRHRARPAIRPNALQKTSGWRANVYTEYENK
eukprot:4027738-Pyramimonas_sp.AAC.1